MEPRSKCTDYSGQKFNQLLFVERFEKDKNSANWLWLLICDCGNFVLYRPASVVNGHTITCGHTKNKKRKSHPLYGTWNGMMQRCLNPKTSGYENYGGRGIAVCERWLEFENFAEDMGQRPDKTTLDRIDNDGEYNKENCRWATYHEQVNNTRRNVFSTFNGQTLTSKQWATKLKLPYLYVQTRAQKGLSIEQIIKESKNYQTRIAVPKNSLIVYHGKLFTRQQLANKLKVPYLFIQFRIKIGLSIEQIEKASKKYKPRKKLIENNSAT